MGEHVSARRAEEYRQQGWTNARAVIGGADAWREAGYPMAGP
jgi:rhodanese-related sulfurtransferase